ncbi:StsA family sactipeptide RiPP [Streptomyces sp. NPDC047108]
MENTSWVKPEITPTDFEADMGCACGCMGGAGAGSGTVLS